MNAANPVVPPPAREIPAAKAFPEGAEGHHAPPVFPDGFEAKADELITHYPVSKRSASLPLLHHWQEAFGYVSPAGIEWIAARLGLQPINVLELVTFYPMFREHPIGKIQIKVCRTLSCALAGSYGFAIISGRNAARASPTPTASPSARTRSIRSSSSNASPPAAPLRSS